MERTVYSAMPTGELIDFALQRDNATPMEIELAQRLYVAMGMVEDLYDARGESQEIRKRPAS